MENNNSTNNERDNDANRFLAVVLISLVWASVLSVSVMLAYMFNGGEFLIRTILLIPFSFGGVHASRSIWKRYQ